MRQNGNVQFRRRPHGGIARIAALRKYQIGLFALLNFERAPLRRPQTEGERKIFRRERADEFGAFHAEVSASEGGDERFFDAARPHIGKPAPPAQFLHHRKIGRHVSRAAAARKEKIFHLSSICRPPYFIETHTSFSVVTLDITIEMRYNCFKR